MADIFLSATLRDRALAEQVERHLIAAGWDVWWTGDHFALHLKADAEAESKSAKCVVVLWSKQSILSQRVCTEAADGAQRRVLVQATLDGVAPPPLFASLPCTNLTAWSTGTDQAELSSFPAFRELASAIRSIAPPEGSITVPQDPPVLDLSRRSAPDTNTGATVRTIFLCYRRQDTQGHTGRLRDRLITAYGQGSVFMDVDDAPIGVDFVEHVEAVLSSCAVMLVVIGPSWASSMDKKGRKKLALPNDLVRAEIEGAIRRKIPLVPLLVEKAEMPDPDDLPEEIQSLTRRTAIELTHRHWEADVQELLKVIEKFMGAGKAGN